MTDAAREGSDRGLGWRRRYQLPFATFAACFFAILWLGAEVTIARLEKENADLKAERGSPFGGAAAAPSGAGGPSPAAAPAPPRAAASARTISVERREAMLQALYGDAPDKRAWLVRSMADPEASAFADELAGVFRAAGWQVELQPWTNGMLKPGVRLFVGPAEAPPVVELVQRALEAGGITLQVFLDYRAYRVERVRAEPNVPGIDLAADQDFVIAVGRAE